MTAHNLRKTAYNEKSEYIHQHEYLPKIALLGPGYLLAGIYWMLQH
jgi:hypothetical protein